MPASTPGAVTSNAKARLRTAVPTRPPTCRGASRSPRSPRSGSGTVPSWPARGRIRGRSACHQERRLGALSGLALPPPPNANPVCAPSPPPGSTAAGRPPPAPPAPSRSTGRSTAGARRGAGPRPRPSVRSGTGLDPDQPETFSGPRHRTARQPSASGRSQTVQRTPERRREVRSRQQLRPAGSSDRTGPAR